MTEDEKKVLEPNFGGSGVRQTLGEAMKDAERLQVVVIVAIHESGDGVIYQSDLHQADLCFLAARLQAHALAVVSDD